jgi:hypothetical protein
MKIQNTYFFGYLFVRFAKVLALLVLVGGAIATSAWTYNYFAAVRGIKYDKDIILERKLDRLENTVGFATREVGRLTSVTDLTPILLPGAPSNSASFEIVTASLVAVNQRRDDLKNRLITDLETKAAKLESELVKILERGNSASSAETSTPTYRAAASISSAGYQTVFGDSAAFDPGSARSALSQIGNFYLGLERNAEKIENRKLLHDTYEEIEKLLNWLPIEIERSVGSRQAQIPSADSAPAINPFVKAQANLNLIRQSVQEVRHNVTQEWELDQCLDETAAILEVQRGLYRGSIAAKDALRTAWISDAGKTIFVTLLLAFVVLVGADWLQSFFDTASRAGQIQRLLERMTGETDQ